MRKAKKEQIQVAFEEFIEKLKALGIANTDMQCHKCKHGIPPFKRCQRCYGFFVNVLTCHEERATK